MPEELFQRLNPHRNKLFLTWIVLIILDLYLWQGILFSGGDVTRMYFLPVGEGDSELIILPGYIKVLVDGGPANGRAAEEIGNILGPTDRRIDLMVLSHPQLDHYGGLVEVAKRYEAGAFLWNGDAGESGGFAELQKVLLAKNVPMVVLSRGDAFCVRESCGEIIWPEKGFRSEDMNDRSLVLALRSSEMTALFTGDLGDSGEAEVLKHSLGPVQVLKAGHHGSNHSTSRAWLNVLRPELAFIEVGKNNYGHPAEETIARLKEIGARIFRTDAGVVWDVTADGARIRVFSE